MKAILVVDMPKSCADCKLADFGRCWGTYSYVHMRSDDIPVGCPLKPIPKELVYEGYDSPNKQICEAVLQSEWGKKAKKTDAICIRAFSIGYNACLEEILNERGENGGTKG